MENAVKLKHFLSHWRAVLLISPSVAAFIISLRVLGLFQLLEWASLDQWFRLRSSAPPDSRIAIVTLDEATIRRFGQWPLNDDILAQLLEKIRQQQPRAIGLDLYRDIPVQPGQKTLVEVMKSTPNLIGVFKVVGDGIGPEVDPPPVLSQLNQVAASDLVLDADGKVRRGLISVESKSGEAVLGLGTKLALMYLEAEGIELQEKDAAQRHYQLGKGTFIPFGKNDGGYVRADERGYQILLNFKGTDNSFKTFSATQILSGKVPKDWGRDRVVLIGANAISLHDDFVTPYSSSLSAFPERMPGVFIHANLVSQILSAALDGRSNLQVLPKPLENLWILGWSVVGASLSWMVRSQKFFKRGITLQKMLGSFVLAGSILIGSSYLFFRVNWWIPLVPPLLSLGGSALVMAIYVTRLEREFSAKLALYNQEITKQNQRLKEENLRMNAELAVTQRIQQMMLPQESELSQIQGLEIAGFMEPTEEVGGDYYDVITSGDCVKIGIGDVTGHGLESGMLMLMAQTAVRTLVESNCTDTNEFLGILNRTLYHNAQRMNCDKNMTLVLLDYQDSILTLSGQHEDIIVVRSNGEIERIDTEELGFPIALVNEIADFVSSREVKLNLGDVVILYTDGVTEALDINNMQYSLERLVEVVKQNLEGKAIEIKHRVIDDLRRHIGEQKIYDDITLVVLKQK